MSGAGPGNRRLLLIGAAAAVAWSAPAYAETICTHIVQAHEYPIPMAEREGERQVQGRVMPDLIAEGDKLMRAAKPGAAVDAYAGVFSNFQYRGVFFGANRCLPMRFYRDAANKLRAAASDLAEQRMARGYLLDERHEYGGDRHDGALRVLLISNQYDEFIRYAFEYAASELVERDIDYELNSMVRNRLAELKRMRDAGSEGSLQYTDDRTPMLDEELAAFDKLAGFDARLRAHLAPLYPEVTDYWLAEEARRHDEIARAPQDSLLGRAMSMSDPAGALGKGIDRLIKHPNQVERLRAKARARGEAFMAKGQFAIARDYFEVADDKDRLEQADTLAKDQQDRESREFKTALQGDLERMQKSDEERATFQEDTDEMAREFGFDLDD
jgi:hypothetical protein